MSVLRNVRMLTHYTRWANALLFDALLKLPREADPAMPAAASGDMLRILNHANVIDQVWQAHLQGRKHGFSARNTDTIPPLPDLQKAQARLDDWYIDYAAMASEDLLEEVIEFRFIGGGDGSMRRGDVLLHVVNHKTYHRGFVAQMIYDRSAQPPTMDLPVFLRDSWKE